MCIRDSFPLTDAFHELRYQSASGAQGVHPHAVPHPSSGPVASEGAVRLQTRVSFTRVIVRPLLRSMEFTLSAQGFYPVSYTHLRAHETSAHL
eukprot:10847558-Alexandrium_andersonii.AAC.1